VAPHVAKSFQAKGDHCSENGPEPAPRHLGAFEDAQIPRGPSFNENDVTDKPASIQKQPKLRNAELAKRTDKYQCRLETLLSVDEGVGEIVKALRKAGELDQTYFIYVSDNGFIQGEHRIKGGKAVPYEGAIRIPMIIRGPDVVRGENAKELVSNVDVVPTILDLGGAKASLPMDGRSFESSLRDTGVSDGRAVLIESQHDPEVFVGVRTSRYLYVERATGESELYDLRADPDELDSVAETPVYSEARASLRATLERLIACTGKACSTTPELTVQAARAPTGSAKENCRSDRVVVSIGGPDAPFVTGTRLGTAGDLGEQGGADPWTISVPKAREAEIVAIAELADGREKRMKETVEGC
jgi:arylsulfatase A-like enzyme